MYCPACSKNVEPGQKFCRSCGLNLASITEAVEGQMSDARRHLISQERKLERFGNFAFTGFGVVVLLAVIAVIYTIIKEMVRSGDDPMVGILLIAFIVFAVLTLAYVIFNESLKEKRRKLNDAMGSIPLQAEQEKTALPEAPPDYIPSAVEDTTRDLKVPRR